MNCKLFKIFIALLFAAYAPALFAQTGKVTMTTQAPAGTELRIYSLPYNDATVTGADKGKFFGIYTSKGPGTEITIEGRIDELEVYGCQLSSLTVESAPTMYILSCYDNALERLSLESCPKLAVLDCHNNRLSSLDVSANNLLETLNAADNALTTATLGSQPNLTKLTLSGNKLAALDLSKLPLLEDLYINNNELTNLDLSANTKVNWIYLFCNKIAGVDMDNFMANLPEAAQSPALLYIVDTFAKDPADENLCLVKNVNTALQKGWVTMDYANGLESAGLTGQIYYGADYVPTISENGVKFTTSRQPGETIVLNIKAAGDFTVEGVAETNFASGKNTLTLASQEVFVKGDLTNFECPGNDITTLSFEGTPSRLTYFDCSNNKIETLAVVNAIALTQLYAQKNALTSFNIEGCTGIMRVDCYNNKLKGNAMKRFMQSLPDGTANNPYLFVIDTKSSSEENVASTTDVAIATGKGWSVFDYSGGDNWGMGKRYEGSEPTEPEIPEEFFTFSTTGVAEVMLNVEFADPDYYPVIENAELLGWNGSALTLRVTPGETVKVYGDLITLAANFAYIDNFDAAACPNLTDLNLMLNELSTLDVSKNTKLQNLMVLGNVLESLDVSGCTELDLIICYGNKLVGDAMTQLMSTLPMRSADKPGIIIIYDGSYDREHNVCTSSDVSAAYKRYWATYELDAEGDPIRYGGYSAIVDIYDACTDAAEYYDLRGKRVNNPSAGIYIRRTGSIVEKVLLK